MRKIINSIFTLSIVFALVITSCPIVSATEISTESPTLSDFSSSVEMVENEIIREEVIFTYASGITEKLVRLSNPDNTYTIQLLKEDTVTVINSGSINYSNLHQTLFNSDSATLSTRSNSLVFLGSTTHTYTTGPIYGTLSDFCAALAEVLSPYSVELSLCANIASQIFMGNYSPIPLWHKVNTYTYEVWADDGFGGSFFLGYYTMYDYIYTYTTSNTSGAYVASEVNTRTNNTPG